MLITNLLANLVLIQQVRAWRTFGCVWILGFLLLGRTTLALLAIGRFALGGTDVDHDNVPSLAALLLCIRDGDPWKADERHHGWRLQRDLREAMLGNRVGFDHGRVLECDLGRRLEGSGR